MAHNPTAAARADRPRRGYSAQAPAADTTPSKAGAGPDDQTRRDTLHAQGNQSVGELAFARQFLIAPKHYAPEPLSNWPLWALSDDFDLYAHPLLAITRAAAADTVLHGLGLFLDPDTPAADDAAILQNLAAASDCFAELETRLAALAGRWLLIATLRGETRVYPDATGQQSIFIRAGDRRGLFAGSQPALLHYLGLAEEDHELRQTFEARANSGSWPIHVTPYPRVAQVLPNHYLALPAGQIQRYWPRRALAEKTVTQAAEEMLVILRGVIAAAMHRRACVISLSGGYDSRTLLAASAAAWHQTEFFSLRHRESAHHDLSIPRRLRRRFKFKHQFVDVDLSAVDPVFYHQQRNVGGMYYGRAARVTTAIQRFAGDRLHLTGTIAEVNRCYYYANGHHPERLTPKALARRAGFADNPLAKAGFSRWLDELPADLSINRLDLLYWEHRLGVWGSCGLAFGDGVVDALPPMNCRRFLEAGLATPARERAKPYALMRHLIARAKPELLDFRFNADWVDDWHRFRQDRLPIPWRAKRALGWVG